MAEKEQASLRGLWLGQQLRELREAAGYNLRDAAEYLENSAATMSRLETAEYPIRRPDLLALLDFYRVSDPRRREELLRLREEAWRKGWWDGYVDIVEHKFVDYAWLESRATRILSFEAMLVPGLLQTREYAHAAIRQAEGPDVADEQIDRLTDLRMERQRVLDRDSLAEFVAVIDEAALRRPIGGADTMRHQLDHLVAQIERPKARVHVLPFSVGWHAGLDGAFRIIDMPDPYPDVGYVESLAGRVYAEKSSDVQLFRAAYDDLQESALDPARSAEMISAIMEEMQ